MYSILIAVAALFLTFNSKCIYKIRKTFLILDAVGIVVFTILECKLAIQMKMQPIIVMMIGTVTGCVGGMMRDDFM
ncbi:hypothetical protein EG348_13870 [Chryseobacterium sp. G0201]|nr:hypothetical protein EG348_13870 [Chryseobacterium sp. G0201]